VAEALRQKGSPDQRIREISTPNLNIPDNNPSGIRATMEIPKAAIVSSIKLALDITHTYIGDLRITLMAPSGKSVVLHDRNGGRGKDIKQTFDLTTTPGLSALVGQSVQGVWALLVQDLAPLDGGKLNRWELEIEGRMNAVVSLEEAPGALIPDNNPSGIERTLDTAEPGQVKEIEVALDITHTYIGDLVVDLVSPAGTVVNLHRREGGSQDNILRTYTMATKPDLRNVRGQPIKGPWRLKVADVARTDVGKLNKWGLRIERAV
jgi:subtilisin-like proprotein convertase family protein